MFTRFPPRAARLAGIVALAASLSACSLFPGGAISFMGPMGRAPMLPRAGATTNPGSAGFLPGTPAAPRVVQITAGPGYRFTPSEVPVSAGETVTFEVTTMGPVAHEFKVGPREAVLADAADLPELTDIGMMQTKDLTYTFDAAGPYAFACHEPGHFEAGMSGTITLVH